MGIIVLYVAFIAQGLTYFYTLDEAFLIGAMISGLAILLIHALQAREKQVPKETGYVTAKIVRSKMKNFIVETDNHKILEQEIHPTNLKVLVEHQLILALHSLVGEGSRKLQENYMVEVETLIGIYKEILELDNDTLAKVKLDIENEYGTYDKRHFLFEYKTYGGNEDVE